MDMYVATMALAWLIEAPMRILRYLPEAPSLTGRSIRSFSQTNARETSDTSRQCFSICGSSTISQRV